MNQDVIITAAQHGWGWSDSLALVSALAALVGVFILAKYTRYTKRLMELTEEALHEARNNNQAALAQTLESNKKTAESNQIARDSIEQGRRAWVAAVAFDAPAEFFPGKLRVKITLANSGGVPGINLRTRLALAVMSSKDFLEETPIVYEAEEVHSFITTSRPIIEILHFDLSKDDIRRVMNGEESLYIIHHLEYADLFNKPRWSMACWQYNHIAKDWVVAPKYNQIT
jgi:hypothetical protein